MKQTYIEQWCEQFTKSAIGIEEMKRIGGMNDKLSKRAKAWNNNYYKRFLVDATLEILSESDITLKDLQKRQKQLDDGDLLETL